MRVLYFSDSLDKLLCLSILPVHMDSMQLILALNSEASTDLFNECLDLKRIC